MILKRITIKTLLFCAFLSQFDLPLLYASKANINKSEELNTNKLQLKYENLEEILLNKNLQILRAKEDIKNANYALDAAKSKYGIQISLDSSIPQYSNGTEYIESGNLETSLINSNASLSLNLPIFDPKKYPEINSTKNKVKLAENSLQNIKDDLKQEASKRFFELKNAKQELLNALQSVRSSIISLKYSKTRFKNGIGNKLDLLEAQAQLSRDEQFLLDRKNNYEIAENSILQILNLEKNLEVSSDLKILGWWDHDLDKTITESLKNNKNLKNILIKKSIEDSDANFALADSRPSFFLSNEVSSSFSKGEFQVPEVDPDAYSSSLNNTVALKLSWNIFDGGLSRSNYNVKKSNSQKETINYQLQSTLLKEEVQNVFETLNTVKDKIYFSQTELDSSIEALKLSRIRFNNGITSQKEVIDAQKDLTSARSRFASNISQYNINLVKISNLTKLKISGLCSSSEQSVNKQDKICDLNKTNKRIYVEI